MVPFPFSLLDSWTPESWLLENPHHILDADSKHKEPSGEPFSASARNCHLAGPITESPKGHFTIVSSQLFQDGESIVRPVNSMRLVPFVSFLYCEVSSLIRSNAVCCVQYLKEHEIHSTKGILVT